jgi:DNA-binding response OmpR family regulator
MDAKRILVIDDDIHQLASIERILKRSGFELDTATNGRTGLRLTVRNMPDLILLDISMPTMSGHEFLRRFRRLQTRTKQWKGALSTPQFLPEIPVIFLTGLAGSKQQVDGLDAGAVDYITKPFDPEELRARVRSQLRRVEQQKKILRSAQSELLQLDSAIGRIQGTVRQCHEALININTYLDLVNCVSLPGLRKDLLNCAKDEVSRLSGSLASVAKLSQTKGVHNECVQ